MIVRSVIGEERTVEKVYDDGSYNCPFCGGAVLPEHESKCRNPACRAGVYATVEHAEKQVADLAEREERAAQRERENAAWRKRMDDSREAARELRARLRAEAEEHGYCVKCILAYGNKKIKHRPGHAHLAGLA